MRDSEDDAVCRSEPMGRSDGHAADSYKPSDNDNSLTQKHQPRLWARGWAFTDDL